MGKLQGFLTKFYGHFKKIKQFFFGKLEKNCDIFGKKFYKYMREIFSITSLWGQIEF